MKIVRKISSKSSTMVMQGSEVRSKRLSDVEVDDHDNRIGTPPGGGVR